MTNIFNLIKNRTIKGTISSIKDLKTNLANKILIKPLKNNMHKLGNTIFTLWYENFLHQKKIETPSEISSEDIWSISADFAVINFWDNLENDLEYDYFNFHSDWYFSE